MKCPFLKETEVLFCQASPFRKMIEPRQAPAAGDRCSSPDYVHCKVAASQPGFEAGQASCPFLRHALMQYCSAASVTKYVPYSVALQSGCQSERHRYCDLFLAYAEAGGDVEERPDAGASNGDAVTEVDGIPVPRHLAYTPNHLWIDEREDGSCYVGVDAFVARVLGTVEEVVFLPPGPMSSPTAWLTTDGTDLKVTRPARVPITAVNHYLRAEPHRITEDPYGRGWLFESRDVVDPCRVPHLDGDLLRGDRAIEWMRRESRRLNAFAHQMLSQSSTEAGRLIQDGGVVEPGLIRWLDRPSRLRLFHEFFSPREDWSV